MAQKIDRVQLQILFTEALEGASFTLIDGLNPFHIEVNGKEYYIYIKNLSPAYFQNPDVWRVQLPIREEFDEIKDTDVPFILLGYDADNDVYTTWNPTWTKQRLNMAESVSFYSRLSLQEEVNSTKEFKRLSLNNDGEVVAFPRESLRLFFASFKGLFQGSGNYVAMGSKKRTEANEAYKLFTDIANIPRYAKYLDKNSYATETINNYTRVVKTLIGNGSIGRSRKMFLACNKLEEYLDIIDSFVKVPEVFEMDDKWHHQISAVLRSYITFLISSEATFTSENMPPTVELSSKANLYALIINPQVIGGFGDYLSSGDAPSGKIYNHSTINHYIRSIKYLTDEGHFERHKDIFDRYNNTNDLTKAFKEFINCPEIGRMNVEVHHDYSAALKQYAFYVNQRHSDGNVTSTLIADYKQPSFIEDSGPIIQYDEQPKELVHIDWEALYTDKNGNLTKIANPKLIEELRPFLDTEYRELATAFNVVESFYGDRFSNMEFSAWGKLFKQIDWSNPCDLSSYEHVHVQQEIQRKKKSILRVEFPDGRIIQHPVAADTFAQVINEHYPELIDEIGIIHAGVPLVSKTLDKKYSDYQKSIDDGWYVFTNIRTEKKQEDLQKISDVLGLDLKVSVVDPDDGAVIIPHNIVSGYNTSSRAKIKVQFPDGRIIQPNKVLDALIEVVIFAGPERVRTLNINVCGDNMITKSPLPRYVKPCKPVGNGWLCNTCSDTATKLEQIQFINERLDLGIVATLV